MLISLAFTALLMGLAGGVHCVAMCAAPCAAVGAGRDQWLFQAGRVAGYSALGALAAASLRAVAWLGDGSALLRPFWGLMHVAALLLGLLLLVQARQPVWLERGAQQVWRAVRHRTLGASSALVLGLLWALLPCGLLYSALLVAALAQGAAGGALVMASFALGTVAWLTAGPALWRWMKTRADAAARAGQPATAGTAVLARLTSGGWGIRLAGLVLAALSGWAIYMDVVHRVQVFCL